MRRSRLGKLFPCWARVRTVSNVDIAQLNQMAVWLDETHGEWDACNGERLSEMYIYFESTAKLKLFETFWEFVIIDTSLTPPGSDCAERQRL